MSFGSTSARFIVAHLHPGCAPSQTFSPEAHPPSPQNNIHQLFKIMRTTVLKAGKLDDSGSVSRNLPPLIRAARAAA